MGIVMVYLVCCESHRVQIQTRMELQIFVVDHRDPVLYLELCGVVHRVCPGGEGRVRT